MYFETENLEKEKVILAGTFKTIIKEDEINYKMQELYELALAVFLEPVASVYQRRDKIEAATYLGKGKVEEISEIASEKEADLLIVNTELNGVQIKNLEETCNLRVIDRTMLILDIFSVRASSYISKLQIELAQLRYTLPRLIGISGKMSRQRLVVGARGPGETKLELDRRKIERRIFELTEELEKHIAKRKETNKQRTKNEIKAVALLGYTNAGKSSIMNLFTEKFRSADESKKVFVKDQLFATLDTFHRKVTLSKNRSFVLVDTVGFVSDLPHTLVKAFGSTLDEAVSADLIIHVVDISNPDFKLQIETCERTISNLSDNDFNMITIYNKSDLLDDETLKLHKEKFMFSAKDATGFDELLNMINENLFGKLQNNSYFIPFDKSYIVDEIIGKSQENTLKYTENGTKIDVLIREDNSNRFKEYLLK